MWSLDLWLNVLANSPLTKLDHCTFPIQDNFRPGLVNLAHAGQKTRLHLSYSQADLRMRDHKKQGELWIKCSAAMKEGVRGKERSFTP